MDKNGITEVKVTKALIDINKLLVFDFSDMNHNSLGPIVVRLGTRYHGLQLVG